MLAPSPAVAAIFEPVQCPTTFEETVERLGTAIRLGLLPPGTRLPPERELAELFAISRSTLRQALTALTQTGHLVALRGRTGGTFVSAEPPLRGPGVALDGQWRDLLDHRIAVETGAVLLASERAGAEHIQHLREMVERMAVAPDFAAYRRADVLFHLGLAEAAGSCRLVSAMTEIQGGMTDLIAHIPHPAAVLERANAQHARLVSAIEAGEELRAVKIVRDHLRGTEHILAGLMP
jgi:GntR family transcriptional regulator, transcriptional repressor for pyruvate dehydrogenase complex